MLSCGFAKPNFDFSSDSNSSRNEEFPRQTILPRGEINFKCGVAEFRFPRAEKICGQKLEDILVDFSAGMPDAFVDNSFYVNHELANHYLEKIREWHKTNPHGAAYLGEKKVLFADNSGEVYAVPLIEIFSQEKPAITMPELGNIIKEENLPFKLVKEKLKFTGRGDLEDSVFDLYDCIAERGLADRLPEGFFEAKVEGYAAYSGQKSADEQNIMQHLISSGLVTRDGKYLTLNGIKHTWGNKKFSKLRKQLGIKDPRRIIPLCAILGFSLGLAYTGSTFQGFPGEPYEEAAMLGGEQMHPEGEVQSEPVIWGEHAAWLDAGQHQIDDLEDIIIKNLTSGEITRIKTNGSSRTSLMMRGDYLVWQETNWNSNYDVRDTRFSINYHNLASQRDGKLSIDKPLYDAYVFGGRVFYSNGSEGARNIFALNLTDWGEEQITFSGINKLPKVFGDFIAWYRTVPSNNGGVAFEIVVKNMKTSHSAAIPLSAEIDTQFGFDIGSKYLVWLDAGRPADTVTLLGHSEQAGTVDVFKHDLRTNVSSYLFGYGSSYSDYRVTVSEDLAVWNAGKLRPFKLTDGRSNHRSGIFVYNISTEQRGPISETEPVPDFDAYNDRVVWGDYGKVYMRQMGPREWRYTNDYFDKENRDLFDFSNSSRLKENSAMQTAIETLVMPPSAGAYLGLAAGYTYYELTVFRPQTQDTKLDALRQRLAKAFKL